MMMPSASGLFWIPVSKATARRCAEGRPTARAPSQPRPKPQAPRPNAARTMGAVVRPSSAALLTRPVTMSRPSTAMPAMLPTFSANGARAGHRARTSIPSASGTSMIASVPPMSPRGIAKLASVSEPPYAPSTSGMTTTPAIVEIAVIDTDKATSLFAYIVKRLDVVPPGTQPTTSSDTAIAGGRASNFASA